MRAQEPTGLQNWTLKNADWSSGCMEQPNEIVQSLCSMDLHWINLQLKLIALFAAFQERKDRIKDTCLKDSEISASYFWAISESFECIQSTDCSIQIKWGTGGSLGRVPLTLWFSTFFLCWGTLWAKIVKALLTDKTQHVADVGFESPSEMTAPKIPRVHLQTSDSTPVYTSVPVTCSHGSKNWYYPICRMWFMSGPSMGGLHLLWLTYMIFCQHAPIEIQIYWENRATQLPFVFQRLSKMEGQVTSQHRSF